MNIEKNHISKLLLLFPVFLFFGLSPQNDKTITLTLADESKLKVTGSSTLHGWDSDATEFSVTFTVSEKWLSGIENWQGDGIETLEVTVPVDKLESGRSRMNRDMREALKAKKHPLIIFTWNDIQVEEEPDFEGRNLLVKGSLQIAGETRDVEFEAFAELLEDNRIKVEGSYRVNMRDYNVDPPTAFLGTLRTDEMVTVEFDLIFEGKN